MYIQRLKEELNTLVKYIEESSLNKSKNKPVSLLLAVS